MQEKELSVTTDLNDRLVSIEGLSERPIQVPHRQLEPLIDLLIRVQRDFRRVGGGLYGRRPRYRD